jgi:peptidoglycan-N-acetylglucosamine deacetylase
MLALLKQYNAHATFFNVGKSVSAWPEVVRTVASAGHYVANHTWDHSALAGLTKEEFVAEAERTRQAILQAAGDLFFLDKDVRYLRPPYGSTDANTRQYAAELGYATVLWDIDPQDWRRPGTEEIADHVLSHVFPGAIVLMHDGGGDRSQSVAALEIILRELSAKGYQFYSIFGN